MTFSIQNPAHRLIQLGCASLGYDPGPIDGWWGPKTHAAATALLTHGPVKRSEWALLTLRRGLDGLGYPPGKMRPQWDAGVRDALAEALDADGEHAASISASPAVLRPQKPRLPPMAHGREMRQGKDGTVVDTYCLHCAAVPGDWAAMRSNREIVEAIHWMHTAPKSKGGRGWSDTGYHVITCPDGETILARPEGRYGAGAVGYNRGVYHHLMIEVRRIDRIRLPEDYFTSATLAAAKTHIEFISQQTPITRLMGHNEVAAKLCPGFTVIDRDWTDRAVT